MNLDKDMTFSGRIRYAGIFFFNPEVPGFNSGRFKCLFVEHTVIWVKTHVF